MFFFFFFFFFCLFFFIIYGHGDPFVAKTLSFPIPIEGSILNLVFIGPVLRRCLTSVDDDRKDDGWTNGRSDGRRTAVLAYTVSSPMSLKSQVS